MVLSHAPLCLGISNIDVALSDSVLGQGSKSSFTYCTHHELLTFVFFFFILKTLDAIWMVDRVSA